MPSQKLTEEQTGPYFEEWGRFREQLTVLHQHRDRQTVDMTIEAVQLYEKLIFRFEEFGIVPLNGEERLRFIKSRPGNYAAFRQLDELFSEAAKKIASKRAQLKRESD